MRLKFMVFFIILLSLNLHGHSFTYEVCNYSDVPIITAASANGCAQMCTHGFSSNTVYICCGWTTIDVKSCSDITMSGPAITGKRMVYFSIQPNSGRVWRSCPKGTHCSKSVSGCSRCDSDFTLPDGKCSFVFNIYQDNLNK